MGRSPGVGKPRVSPGRYALGLGLDTTRAARAGSALRLADHGEESVVHFAGRVVAGAGDWRECRDLQFHGHIAVAVAAGVRSEIAGGAEMAQAEPADARLGGAQRQRLIL